jgi:hypothetical protein
VDSQIRQRTQNLVIKETIHKCLLRLCHLLVSRQLHVSVHGNLGSGSRIGSQVSSKLLHYLSGIGILMDLEAAVIVSAALPNLSLQIGYRIAL